MSIKKETPMKLCLICGRDVGLNRRKTQTKFCLECANKQKGFKKIKRDWS